MSDDPKIRSEDDVIHRFLRPLSKGCPAALNLEDDAASWTATPGTDLVVSKDALVAGVHFFPDDPPADIGYKAGAVNVSDLVAKGAAPVAYFLALALPASVTATWMQAFTEGLGHWVRGKLAGGDLTRTDGPLMITVTAIGEVPTGTMVRRRGAQPGDHVYLTGTLGGSTAGLALLEIPKAYSDRISADDRAALITAFRRPEPPFALTEIIRTYASAALDVSDGLVRDATRLCRLSNVGMEIDAAVIPLAPAARNLMEAGGIDLAALLTGGDDYQVLMTVPESRSVALREAVNDHPAKIPVTRIGVVTAQSGELKVQDAAGTSMVFQSPGHDHF